MSIYKGHQHDIDIPTATNVEIKLSGRSKEHLFRISESVSWQAAFSEDQLTADKGQPFNAGEAYTIDSPVADGQSLWVRQTSGGTVSMRHMYLYPTLR